jgi:hypothetical protein
VQRLIDSGLLGQKVLEWLAGVLPRIDGDPSHAPLVTVGDPIVVTAALWLRAVGIGSDTGEAA